MSEVLTFIYCEEDNEVQIFNWLGLDVKNLIRFTADMIHTLAEFEPYKTERTEKDEPIIKVTMKGPNFSIWSSEKKRESIELLSNAISVYMQTL